MNATTLSDLMQSNSSGTVRTYAALMGDNLGYPCFRCLLIETSWVAKSK